MTKPDLFKRVMLLVVFIFTIGGISLAQSATDFWQAFEKCAQASEFQMHYPNQTPGQTLDLTVMNNGIAIPSNTGITFSGNRTFSVEDKGYVTGNGLTEFFIIQDARFVPGGAHFEVIYYYNFDGSYNTFVRGSFELSNSTGAWAVSSTTIQ